MLKASKFVIFRQFWVDDLSKFLHIFKDIEYDIWKIIAIGRNNRVLKSKFFCLLILVWNMVQNSKFLGLKDFFDTSFLHNFGLLVKCTNLHFLWKVLAHCEESSGFLTHFLRPPSSTKKRPCRPRRPHEQNTSGINFKHEWNEHIITEENSWNQNKSILRNSFFLNIFHKDKNFTSWKSKQISVKVDLLPYMNSLAQRLFQIWKISKVFNVMPRFCYEFFKHVDYFYYYCW